MGFPLSVVMEVAGDGFRLVREDAGGAVAGVRMAGGIAGGGPLREDILYVAGADSPVAARNVLAVREAGGGPAGQNWDEAWGAAGNLAAAPGLSVREAAERAADALEALAAWDAEIVEAVLGGRPVEEVLAIGARMLANPVALFDENSALVAHAGDLPPGYEKTIWGRVLREGASPLDYYTRDEQARIARELTAGGAPGIFMPSRSPGHSNLAALVAVDGDVFGSIGQVDLVAPFTAGQIALAEHVRDRLQQSIALKRPRRSGEDGLAALVSRIIAGEQVDRSLLGFYLGRRGWAEDGSYRITVCPIPAGTDNTVVNATRREMLMRHVPDGAMLIHAGALVVLEHGASGPHGQDVEGSAPASAPPRVGCCSKGFSKALAQLGLHAAASDWFEGVMNARHFHRQALFALAESERMGCAEGDVARYGDMFEGHLAHLVAGAVPVESICDQRVLALARDGLKGDRDRGRELVRELYVYLAGGRNLNRCAELLYVHRNTLSYRISKIEEIVGRDLASLSPGEVVRLELSCLLALNE